MPAIHHTHTDRVARVTLDRPPLNVVDLGTARALADALERLSHQDDVAVVVLAARGKAFSAGVDVRDHLPDRGAETIGAFDRACRALIECDAPTLAVVQGAALGGGFELALCCDLMVAAESATFGLPEIKLGVFPPVAAVALPRILPYQRAAELLLLGEPLTAEAAAAAGLVNRVVEAQELEAAAEEMAGRLRALSAPALRAAKRALRLSRARPSADEIAKSEEIYLKSLLHHADAIEGLNAFLEKRAPRWPSG